MDVGIRRDGLACIRLRAESKGIASPNRSIGHAVNRTKNHSNDYAASSQSASIAVELCLSSPTVMRIARSLRSGFMTKESEREMIAWGGGMGEGEGESE
jgi:hypothetical protein